MDVESEQPLSAEALRGVEGPSMAIISPGGFDVVQTAAAILFASGAEPKASSRIGLRCVWPNADALRCRSDLAFKYGIRAFRPMFDAWHWHVRRLRRMPASV